jgi:hypothetical protein
MCAFKFLISHNSCRDNHKLVAYSQSIHFPEVKLKYEDQNRKNCFANNCIDGGLYVSYGSG